MDKDELQKRIREEEDYIRCPKCSNSLIKFLAKNSDGVDNAVIARLLMIPEEQVEQLYQEAVQQLRAEMVEEDDN
jgi:ssDNA-binding Zn-finger/Zn-ribbon topoisomerase 1